MPHVVTPAGASPATSLPVAGTWQPGGQPPAFGPAELQVAIEAVRQPAFVVREADNGRVGLASGGAIAPAGQPGLPLLGALPALYPEWLGDRGFCEAHGVRFAYIAGEMANGIATAEMVIAMAGAGMLGFFGSAGLPLDRVEENLGRIRRALGDQAAWGANLIHSPQEPALEEQVVDLFLRMGVRRVSASAFMGLTPAIVRYALTGLTRGADGRIIRQNHVFAKVSRPEVARHFMAPAPQAMVDRLLASGQITAEAAALAAHLPIAEDVTAEADSGGHTDNRPLTALFPTILALRDELHRAHGYTRPIRVGAAGGLGTPSAVAAAFGLGAAYVMIGSVNQSAKESGVAPEVRRMLAQADLADIMMAPAGDMFELGVKVQVLKKGTMFGPRALRLYEVYGAYDGLESLPAALKAKLEQDVFHKPLEVVWEETRAYFATRDPHQIARAERDPKHRMALVFRWYLGQSSRWAIAGDPTRRLDYQIWCGPAMGAFNAWVKGSFLEAPEHRDVVQIALNLLEGAAVVTRAHQLRTYGAPLPSTAFDFRPRPLRHQ
jgi:PfaD family protein